MPQFQTAAFLLCETFCFLMRLKGERQNLSERRDRWITVQVATAVFLRATTGE